MNPHPYLTIWLGCKRHSTELIKLLPNAGGWLDQPAEVMLAFEICEELYKEEERANKAFVEAEKQSENLRERLLAR